MATNLDRPLNTILGEVFDRLEIAEASVGVAFSRLPAFATDGTPTVGETITFDPGAVTGGAVTAWTIKRGTTSLLTGANGNSATLLLADAGTLVAEVEASNSRGQKVFKSATLEVAAGAQPTVQFAATEVMGNEGSTLRIIARRSNTSGAASIQGLFAAGSTAPADFVGNAYPGNKTWVFAAGSDAAFVDIATVDDSVFEGPESFSYTIVPGSGYVAGANNVVTGRIIDNDAAPGDAFLITSPKTESQPTGSPMYRQLEAEEEGTGFEILPGADSAEFTLVQGIITLKPKAYAAGGKNSYTTQIKATNPAGEVVIFDYTRVVTDLPARQQQSMFYELNFTQPAGQKLGDTAGWQRKHITDRYSGDANQSQYDFWTFNGDGIATLGESTPDLKDHMVVMKTEPAGNDFKLSINFMASRRTFDDRILTFSVLSTADASRMLIVEIKINSGVDQDAQLEFNFFDYSNGAAVYLSTLGGIPIPGAATNPKAMDFIYNSAGRTLTLRDVDGREGLLDLSSRPVFDGRYVVIGGPKRQPSQNTSCNRFVLTSAAGGLVINSAPFNRADNTATLSFTATGVRATNLEHRLLSQLTGAVVSDWAVGTTTVTGDAASSSGTYLVTVPTLVSYLIEVRNRADTAITAVARNPTNFGVEQAPLAIGYNLDTPALNASMFTDWGRDCRYDSISPTEGTINYPFRDITGSGTIEVDPGWELFIDYGAGANGMEELTKISNTMYRYRISRDHVTSRIIKWRSPPGTPAPYVIKKMKVTPDNSNGQEFTQKYLDQDMGTGFRTLDVTYGNDSDRTRPFWTPEMRAADANLSGYAYYFMPIDVMARLATIKNQQNQKFKWFHLPHRFLEDDAEHRRQAEAIRDYLSPSVYLISELSNEIWNGPGFSQDERMIIEGIRKGFYNTNSSETPSAPLKVLLREDAPRDSKGDMQPMVSPVMKAGEAYYENYALYIAKRDVPAGLRVPGAYQSDDNFQYFMDAGALKDTREKYASWLHKHILDIYKDVLGEARFIQQVRPGVFIQPGSPASVSRLRRSFTPGYEEMVKIIGTAGYYFDGIQPSEVQNTTATRIFTGFSTGQVNTINYLQSFFAGVAAEGKMPCVYEGGAHLERYRGGYKDTQYMTVCDEIASVDRNTGEIKTDPRWAQTEYDFTKMLMDIGAGPFFFYKLNSDFTWGLLTSNFNATPRWTGHKAALDGQPRPA